MTTKRKLSYHDIARILEENGWMRNEEAEEKFGYEYHFYEMTLLSRDYEVTVRAWVGEDDGAIDFGGHYGICDFEIAKYGDREFPYSESNLTDMLYAMELAENNLLSIGIPFCPGYRFSGSNAANKRRRSKALRKKFNLLPDEKKSYRRKLAKFSYSPEEVEMFVATEYPDEN